MSRNNFFIHGGAEAGSIGCIDLWDSNDKFFQIFLELIETPQKRNLKNDGKIPLIVKYKENIKVECDDDFTKECKIKGD